MSAVEVPERRGTVASDLADVRVNVATIAATQRAQTTALESILRRLDAAVFREEFERRLGEQAHATALLEGSFQQLRDAQQQAVGEARTWRLVFSGAIAILTVVVGILYVLKP